ncbi:uncharacterized protein LOC130698114 [Daphnia carinata]|uniref:uncharacterized protein LOC130698114 n=1 Tax=Daphnia carinata TaxID=120202 RepID=UPI00257A009F|nr:uncharacterized protein LOC130698114 [Daphnia carinata]
MRWTGIKPQHKREMTQSLPDNRATFFYTAMNASISVYLIVGVLLVTSSVRSAPQQSEAQGGNKTSPSNNRRLTERLTVTNIRVCQTGYYRDFLGKCRKTY